MCVHLCLLLLKLADKATPRNELNLTKPPFRDLWGPNKISIIFVKIKSALHKN